MSELTQRLTDTVARKLPLPDKGYAIHWCKDTPGFGVRVTAAGARAWIMERRVNGKTVRRTLGKAEGRSSISAESARKLMVTRSSELQHGVDELDERRKQAEQDALDITLEQAIRQYIKVKRRAKDDLPLKPRTKADYEELIAPPRPHKLSPDALTSPGHLYTFAHRKLSTLTGDEIHALFARIQAGSGRRRAINVMRYFRAVLKWAGVKMPNDPFAQETPGRFRIQLPQSIGKPRPMAPHEIATWWRVASGASDEGLPTTRRYRHPADLLRFELLTGVRGGESAGSEHLPGILVEQVDLPNRRILLRDTKNRRDHTLYLSRQAFEIVERHATGKKSKDKLFAMRDAQKTLDAICRDAGVARRTPHQLRQTFATIAEALVPTSALKAMVNHTSGGDVTQEHYLGRSEQELRAAWQKVADYIEELAGREAAEQEAADERAIAALRKEEFARVSARLMAMAGKRDDVADFVDDVPEHVSS